MAAPGKGPQPKTAAGKKMSRRHIVEDIAAYKGLAKAAKKVVKTETKHKNDHKRGM